MKARAPQWTAAEDEVVCAAYARGDLAHAVAALPGRTVSAIKQRASRLGVRGHARTLQPDEHALAELDGVRVTDGDVIHAARLGAGLTITDLMRRSGYNEHTLRHVVRLRTAIDVLEACGFDLVLRRRT